MLNTIGVIGAGQMGSGIAHVCALADREVVLMDIDLPLQFKFLNLTILLIVAT